MPKSKGRARARVTFCWVLAVIMVWGAGCDEQKAPDGAARGTAVQLGPRPFYLVDRLENGPLRDALERCRSGPFRPTRFSIGHRGAPLQFPEHTRESYEAAIRMGAGIVECDVTFTADRELVCRHAQCDLHRTTNILVTPLAGKCSEGFHPAELDPETGALLTPAHARCCASDLTLSEFKRLEGKMDAANPRASSPEQYLDATPDWRTDLYSNRGTLMSHDESIALFQSRHVAMTPELKAPEVEMPFQGSYRQQDFARQMLEAYRAAGIPPEDVYPQSFDLDDIRVWREVAPEHARQAVWLDGRTPADPAPEQRELTALAEEGLRFLAPPISTLLQLDETGAIQASEYAHRAKRAGLELIPWSFERSGRIDGGRVEGRDRDFYYDSVLPALRGDGDLLRILHVLAQDVGVRSVFSDWPATTTFYANCFGLE